MDEYGKACIMQATKNQLPLALTAYCNTPDRKAHFQQVTRYFQTLYAHLAAFFGDCPISEDCGLSDIEKAHFRAYRDELIALYTLCHDAWHIIKGRFEASFPQINSAGDLIRAIIDQDARGLFFICCPSIDGGNDHIEFSPRRVYADVGRQQKRLNRWWADLQMNRDPDDGLIYEMLRNIDPYRVLRSYVWLLCIDAASKEPILKQQLQSYELAEKKLWDPMFKALHPSQNPQGFQWLKGKLRKAQKHRGYA